jgi:osmoprotectant transport system permease protein
VNTLREAVRWLSNGVHWSGSEGVPTRMLQHLEVSVTAVAIAAAIAIPLGLYIGHTRRLQFLSVSIANVGRAVPSFGILVIAYVVVLHLAPSLAFGFTPTVVALVLLAIPPILTNTYVGVEAVDRDMVEAARGMGMSEREVLLRLEVPLATGLIMAGVRTSAVTVVATATLSALIGGGTLGRYIVDGFAQSDNGMLVAGSILVALLAVITEVGLGILERRLTPRTRSRA